MPIESWRELARSVDSEVRNAFTAKRTFVLTLTDNTLSGGTMPTELQILTALGLEAWGSAHPTMTGLGLRKISITERHSDSPYHIQVTAEYGVMSASDFLDPLSRAAEWTFKGEPLQVAALYYWDGGTRTPLTNSAGDYFEGLTSEESCVKVTRSQNLAVFPSVFFTTQNTVNSSTFLGCPIHTVKVTGVDASYTKELFNASEYSFWTTTVSFSYRESGWNLQLPDVGWNYIDAGSGQKRRAMVFDFQNNEWVASANPVALSGGAQVSTPDVLNRRIFNEADLAGVYGFPAYGWPT